METFLTVTTGGGVAAKYSTIGRSQGCCYKLNNYLAPNVISAKVEEGRLSEVGTVKMGDSLRGYLAPHLGHIKLEIFMLNCPRNHTAQNEESKKWDWQQAPWRRRECQSFLSGLKKPSGPTHDPLCC